MWRCSGQIYNIEGHAADVIRYSEKLTGGNWLHYTDNVLPTPLATWEGNIVAIHP